MGNIVEILRSKALVDYIGDLQLSSSGIWRCSCPIHGGSNESSFAVFPGNSFYCFSCGAHGSDVISYKMQRDSVPFDVAIHELAEEYGLTISDDDSYVEQRSLADRNHSWMTAMEKNVDNVREYLHGRGFDDAAIAKFHFGYSTKNSCLSIPFFDIYGRCVGFCYRYFEGKSKYKNSRNNSLFQKNSFLYNENFAQVSVQKTKTLYLAEGCFDVASAEVQGLSAVAYCGINLCQNHMELIKKLLAPIKGSRCVLAPDADGKASRFVPRARTLFRQYFPDCTVKVAVIPEGCKDFNDMLKAGLSIADDCTYESIDLYCAKQIISNESDTDVQEKLILDYMRSVSNPIARQDIATYLAGVWHRDISVVRELLAIREDTSEEKLRDIATVSDAYAALETMDTSDFFGIGYENIDKTIQVHRKDVLIIGAASNSGKSENLLEMVLYWCIALRKVVLFFSLEMPKEDIMAILVAKIIQQPRWKIPEFIKEHKDTYQLIIEKLDKQLYIVDKPGLTLDDMADYVRLLKTRISDVDVVAVDYFQKMKALKDVADQEAAAEGMKDFAKELNVLFVMLSQFAKSGQGKDAGGKWHEPEQKDLRGSGAIGDSADYILLLWRRIFDTSLGEIDREKFKYDTCVKIVKARKRRNGNMIFTLEYSPVTERLTEKVADT